MLVVNAIQYREDMIRYARTIVGDAAEDVVQDITEYLLRARMPTSRSPKGLLLWYVRNRSIQHFKAERRRTDLIQVQSFNDDMAELGIYENRYQPPEYADKMDKLLDRLAEVDTFARQLFILVYCYGYSLAKISRESGLDLSRLHYIKRETKKILQNGD